MGALLLGIDIGTSACKAALFDAQGRALATAEAPYAVCYPRPGFAEQDPDMWWRAVCETTRALLSDGRFAPGDIAGIGVAGQSWSAVAVDESGNVLAPTPIWTDTRATEECALLKRTVGEDALFSLCGNPVQPSYTLPKILWYKRSLPDVYRKARAMLQSNSFIVYRLTGALTQDVSQGYGLCCFDMRAGAWNADIARACGIAPSLLPSISACHQVVGQVSAEAAALTGLRAGTPVVAGGLDAACGTLGAGVIAPGQTQEQGGQAGGMSLCMDACLMDKRLILGFHVVPGRWLLQGGTTGGGGALKWLRETVCPELSFSDMSALAADVPPGSEGVLFLPYMAGERSPIWNPSAKGVLFGLDFGKTRAHMIRAVMEGVAFALRHNLETAEQAGAAVGTLRAMGGSAKSEVWTQIKADACGRVIETPDGDTATALGAALLAGVGTGVYGSFDEAVSKTVRVRRICTPDNNRIAVYDAAYARYLALYERLSPMMRGNETA